ncbi:MAG: glycine/betaine ABC transporter substrate-binding protein [Candidatus Saccharibacteria bacterium]|nr:glycine/betaine ABC transporter substrate-binding protein [Microbacteriaceae bacterium]
MKITKKSSFFAVSVVVACVLITSACSATPASTSATTAGSIKPVAKLKGVALTVGSKEYDEQLILGQIAIAALEAAGATVKDQTGLQGTGTVRTALTSGQIDLYWEYSGTGWFSLLGQTDPHPAAELYKLTSAMDLAKNKISWLAAAPMNDTYAIGVTNKFSKASGVKSISDMVAYTASHPGSDTLCVESEFLQRPDGLPGMEKAYGLKDMIPKKMGGAVIYTELATGTTCNYGAINSTDGRLVSLGLMSLKDDKGFFPAYNPAVTMTQATLQKYPEIKALLEPIAAKIDDKTITTLNSQAAEGTKPRTIALNWLKSAGFVG